MKKQTILFLAANPSGMDGRALDREARAIRGELKRSRFRDRFELVTRWAVEPLDLLRELRELEPVVVHFSGRGGQTGLFFQAADGRARAVSSEAIVETFGAVGRAVKLVVLNACYSEALAEALLAHVDCVVGMGGAIRDDAARSFAVGFYGGLGERASVAAAFAQGRAAIRLEGLADADRSRLKVRAGVDAGAVIRAKIAPPAAVDAPCPYPGMLPYSADTAAHFHGRDEEVEELIRRLRAGEREIYVIGPSGSGKSSLVAAGLVPRLTRGVSGLGTFVVRTMRPGEHPIARLAEVLETPEGTLVTPSNAITALLADRPAHASLLIVIDQLEELFTQTSGDEREGFLIALGALRTDRRCVVVLALRADFFGAFMESPLWTERRGQISRVEVGPLRGKALRNAIGRPARALGVTVEPALIERLFADASEEPGILPLLQETLVQLWDRWRHRMRELAGDEAPVDRERSGLTLADYQAMGEGGRSGMAVALSSHADAIVRALTPLQEQIVRRILLRLISFGEGRSDTRRQQPYSALRAADDNAIDFDAVLRKLVDGRLVTTDVDHRGEVLVDLAHEIMIDAWPMLASWSQTRRADEQRRRQLEAAVAQWIERGRGAGGLLDEILLADAEAWRLTETARELGESPEVAALIAASRAAHDDRRRRSRIVAWLARGAVAIFSAGAVALWIMARLRAAEIAAREQAEAYSSKIQQLNVRLYQEWARQYLLENRPQEAVPYLVAARDQGEDGSGLRMLFWMAVRSLSSTHFTNQPLALPLEHRGVQNVAFSPDSKLVATMSSDDITKIWDAASGKQVPSQRPEWAQHIRFNPYGTRIVVRTIDDNAARVRDAATREQFGTFQHRGRVQDAAFSPDGARVITASDDTTAQIWDADTGKPLAMPLHHRGRVLSVAFSPDGTRVITASDDGIAYIWEFPIDAITDDQSRQLEKQSSFTLEKGALIPRSSGREPPRPQDPQGPQDPVMDERPRRRVSPRGGRRCRSGRGSASGTSARRGPGGGRGRRRARGA